MISGESSLPASPAGASPSASAPDGDAAPREALPAAPASEVVRQLAATLQVEAPAYNPITLCGPAGSSKSWLGRWLAERHKQLRPQAAVLQLTAVEFSKSFGRAVEADTLPEFRARVRRLEFLVLDDLHTLAGKVPAQQELSQTLDALVRRGALAVLSSRMHPGEGRGLIRPLVSRLSGGLIVPLAGASAGDSQPSRRTPAVSQVVAAVGKYFHIPVAAIKGTSRRREIVRARSVAMFLAREITGLSLENLGRQFGDRDHTTVLHAVRNVTELLEQDPAVRSAVEELRLALTQEP